MSDTTQQRAIFILAGVVFATMLGNGMVMPFISHRDRRGGLMEIPPPFGLSDLVGVRGTPGFGDPPALRAAPLDKGG